MSNTIACSEHQQAIVLSTACLHGQPLAFDYCSFSDDKTRENAEFIDLTRQRDDCD